MYQYEEISMEEGKALAKELNAIYKRTSAKVGKSIEDLFTLIAKKFLHHDPEISDNLKSKELKLRERKITLKKEEKKSNINDEEQEDNVLKENLEKYKIEIEKLNKKINELEDELKKEKNKNKVLEEKIKIFENSEKYKSKEELFSSIMLKDKELNELKIKLGRYPIELNEGEKLMTVNFVSVDSRIQHYSLICKNTDIFNVIEKRLYDDYKEYYETENYFTVNGTKIHKLKSLEENKINNNDVIILNTFDI